VLPRADHARNRVIQNCVMNRPRVFVRAVLGLTLPSPFLLRAEVIE
jgi:hypothetical protein